MTPVRSRFGKYSCYEIALNGRGLSRAEKGSAERFFLGCGVPAAELVITDYRGVFRACYYTKTARRAGRIRRFFRAARLKGLRLRVKTLGRHDWFDKWKREYRVRTLGTKFMIVPAWEKKPFKKTRRLPVFLDPGSAFGSGYHETTRLMVRLLESYARRAKNFLDIGTGTGILAVVASKLGAGRAVGFDNDKQSATVARKNFLMNGCRGGDFFCAHLKTLKLKERFAVVGANLLSKTLIDHQRRIKKKVASGGYLIVSGIAKENLASFRAGFFTEGFKCLKVLRGRKWVALVYKRS